LLLGNYFEFVPIVKASGWSIDDGQPRLWWWARLDERSRVFLSDGTDPHKLEAAIQVSVGAATPIGKLSYSGKNGSAVSWGFFSYPPPREKSLDWIGVRVAVSQDNFDRIMRSMERVGPPTLRAGFGPQEAFAKLTGGLTRDSNLVYHWDNTVEPNVSIEGCDFFHTQSQSDRSAPYLPERAPRFLRLLGAGFTLATNLIALLIAVAMFAAAGNKFETATVSVLLLVYVNGVSSNVALGRTLMQMDLRALWRFWSLRELVGVPKSPEEQKYLTAAQERIDKPGAAYWINNVSYALIALLAIYKLITVLWSQ
jgi:hypothetical protein